MPHKYTTQTFVERCNDIHNRKYDYSITEYINANTNVEIICDLHGTFSQRPWSHLQGRGCRFCRNDKNRNRVWKTCGEFIDEANIVHNDFYCYNAVTYVNIKTKVSVICPTHGVFDVTPDNHIHKKSGCPVCARGNFSMAAIQWMDNLSITKGVTIQHAMNGGEVVIPSTRFRVDGFDSTNNHVYEYYGDKFHGNPSIFNDDVNCHPYDKIITAAELYEATMHRETKIRSLGYKLTTRWESDTIDKYVEPLLVRINDFYKDRK